MPNCLAYEEADQKPSLELGTGRRGGGNGWRGRSKTH